MFVSRRTISALLIFALLAMDAVPVFAVSPASTPSHEVLASDQRNLVDLPPFPEDAAMRAAFDWSSFEKIFRKSRY